MGAGKGVSLPQHVVQLPAAQVLATDILIQEQFNPKVPVLMPLNRVS